MDFLDSFFNLFQLFFSFWDSIFPIPGLSVSLLWLLIGGSAVSFVFSVFFNSDD